MKTIILTAMTAAVLAGCAKQQEEATESLYNTAGAQLDVGGFGNATLNNLLVQTGQQNYAVDLTRRFASEVNSTVNFAFNSSTLDADARATLTQQANWIRQFPEVRFRVYGHTDLVGGQAANRRLGLARAQAAVSYLTTQGIDRSRLEAVASFGETRPLVSTENPERRNRRTVTEVSGFVDSNPSTLDGQYAATIFREYVTSATATTTASETVITTGTGE